MSSGHKESGAVERPNRLAKQMSAILVASVVGPICDNAPTVCCTHNTVGLIILYIDIYKYRLVMTGATPSTIVVQVCAFKAKQAAHKLATKLAQTSCKSLIGQNFSVYLVSRSALATRVRIRLKGSIWLYLVETTFYGHYITLHCFRPSLLKPIIRDAQRLVPTGSRS